MSLLTEDFDLSPLVPIDTKELGHLRMGLSDMMQYAEGHSGSFQIDITGEFGDEYGESVWRNLQFTVRPSDVFETVDVNYHSWETVWCPADIDDIVSWLETALYELNKDYFNPYRIFKICSVHYGKYQIIFRPWAS